MLRGTTDLSSAFRLYERGIKTENQSYLSIDMVIETSLIVRANMCSDTLDCSTILYHRH